MINSQPPALLWKAAAIVSYFLAGASALFLTGYILYATVVISLFVRSLEFFLIFGFVPVLFNSAYLWLVWQRLLGKKWKGRRYTIGAWLPLMLPLPVLWFIFYWLMDHFRGY